MGIELDVRSPQDCIEVESGETTVVEWLVTELGDSGTYGKGGQIGTAEGIVSHISDRIGNGEGGRSQFDPIECTVTDTGDTFSEIERNALSAGTAVAECVNTDVESAGYGDDLDILAVLECPLTDD